MNRIKKLQSSIIIELEKHNYKQIRISDFAKHHKIASYDIIRVLNIIEVVKISSATSKVPEVLLYWYINYFDSKKYNEWKLKNVDTNYYNQKPLSEREQTILLKNLYKFINGDSNEK